MWPALPMALIRPSNETSAGRLAGVAKDPLSTAIKTLRIVGKYSSPSSRKVTLALFGRWITSMAVIAAEEAPLASTAAPDSTVFCDCRS